MKGSLLNYLKFFILSFLLLVLEGGEMYMRFGYEDASFPYENYIIIAMIIITAFHVIMHQKDLTHTKFFNRFATTLITIYVFTVLWSLINPLHSRNVYGYLLLPLFMFMYMYVVTRKMDSFEVITYTMYAVAVTLAIYFLMNYNSGFYDVEQQSNTSYTVLYFLPMMLCVPKIWLRYVAIILTIITVMFSLKRGGFIAVIIGVVVYFYISQVKIDGKRLKMWGWLVLLVLGIGGYWAIVRVNNMLLDNMMFDRIAIIEETGGSGRANIYKNVFDLIGLDGIVPLLFGHGWRATADYTYSHLTAHNDFLEILFDFGITGLVFYIAMIVESLNVARILIRKKSEYAPAMGASLAIFLVNSMVSHIMIYCQYLLIFAMFWGFISATSQRQHKYK